MEQQRVFSQQSAKRFVVMGYVCLEDLCLFYDQATFSGSDLTTVLDGGEAKTERRRWIGRQGEMFNNAANYNLTREEIVTQHVERFIKLHQKYADDK